MDSYIYLDNAATSFPKSEAVYRAMDEANREFAVNAGRGSYVLAEKAGNIIEETRGLILTLAQAQEMAEVVFTPSATFACNQILGGLCWEKSDVVYVSPYEHNAVMRVLYVLQKRYGFEIEELAMNVKTLELDLEKIKYQFIQKPPSVLCMTQVSNVTGYVLPVEEVAALVRGSGTTVIVDGSQAFGLIPMELKESGIDFYVFAGHKTLCGPFGIGGYVNHTGKRLEVVFAGGTGSDSLNLEMPEVSPGRYEPGSPNVVAAAGLYAALEELGRDRESMYRSVQGIRQKERFLFRGLEEELLQVPGVRLYFPMEKERRSGICSFNVEGYQAADVGMLLDEDYGIAVRCGYHCAPLIHKYLRDESFGGTVRVSVGRFNTEDDVERLVRAVDEIARG